MELTKQCHHAVSALMAHAWFDMWTYRESERETRDRTDALGEEEGLTRGEESNSAESKPKPVRLLLPRRPCSPPCPRQWRLETLLACILRLFLSPIVEATEGPKK